ncbi:MAG: hypothetical protein JWN67_3924 [Actinomycetia bacterium]|nr:hypothetical protein [Actinomycetes bacterium]
MRKLVVALICVLSVGAITTPPASAHVLINHDWGQGDAVGTPCGLTYGGYVKAVQAMLWADHRYLDQGHGWVNGNFTGESPAWTDGAIRNFQSACVPPADGCIGFNAWRVMQSMTTFQYSSGWQDIWRFHTY